MADGSDYEVTKRGQSSTVKPRKSAFGLGNPLAVAALVVLAVVLAVLYSNHIGYQLDKPAWAFEWALLIFANIGLSIFVLFVGDSLDNKPAESSFSARSIFVISLGVVITVGLYCCIEFFVTTKPAFVSLHDWDWKDFTKDVKFEGTVEQMREQNNIIRLLGMWLYNYGHNYAHACDEAYRDGVKVVGYQVGKASYGCMEEAHYSDFLWCWYIPALALFELVTIICAGLMVVLATVEAKGGRKSLSRLPGSGGDMGADLILRIRQELAAKQAELDQLRRDHNAAAGARRAAEAQVADLRTQLSVLEADLSCVETAAAEMSRIKAQADALEQKLAPCIAGLSGATVAVFQDVMKIFAKARQDLGIAPQGLSAHATALRKKIDDIKAQIARGLPAPGSDASGRIARLEGEIETLTNWLKASEAQVRPTAESVELDEDGQVDIPGVLMSGRYELKEGETKKHPVLMLFFAGLLLTLNNFAIAPEISNAIDPKQHYFEVNIGILAVLGILACYALTLFRRREAGPKWPWLSWLIATASLVTSGVLLYILSHLPVSPPPPPPPPLSAIILQPMTVSCDLGRNIGSPTGPRTTVAWTFGSPEQIDVIQASPEACHIALKDDPNPKYAVAVGIASQEGSGNQFKLSAQRAARLADIFQSEHKHAKLYMMVIGAHKKDGVDAAPTLYRDAHLTTRNQRQAVLLGGNVDTETKDPVLLFNDAVGQLGQSLTLDEYPLRCFYQRDPKTLTWTVVQTTPKDAAPAKAPPECPVIP